MEVRPEGSPPPREVGDWQAAEANAVEWMRWLGHRDAQPTKPGADGGVDVMAQGAFAQVKWYGRPVGVGPLRQLFGARANRPGRLYFFVNAGYSKPALTFAESVDMAAFVYSSATGLIRPVSPIARSTFRAAVARQSARKPGSRADAGAAPGKPAPDPRHRDSSTPSTPLRTTVEYLPAEDGPGLSKSQVSDVLRSLRQKRDARVGAPRVSPDRPDDDQLAGPGENLPSAGSAAPPQPSATGCLSVGGLVAAGMALCCNGTVHDGDWPAWLAVSGAAALLLGIAGTIAAVRQNAQSDDEA